MGDEHAEDPVLSDHLNATGALGHQASSNQATNVGAAAKRVETAAAVATNAAVNAAVNATQATHAATNAAEHAAENHAITEAQLDKLAVGVLAISDGIVSLADLVTTSDLDSRRDRKRHLIVLATIILAAALILGAVGLAFWNQSRANHRQAVTNGKAAALIASCTTPTGKCFQDQQRRLAISIGDPPAAINSVTVWTSVCSAHVIKTANPKSTVDQDYTTIRACILAHLKK